MPRRALFLNPVQFCLAVRQDRRSSEYAMQLCTADRRAFCPCFGLAGVKRLSFHVNKMAMVLLHRRLLVPAFVDLDEDGYCRIGVMLTS
jgi:hypothetical protein